MDSKTIEIFYDKVGYVEAYTTYLVLFFFLISPAKIKLTPFYWLFINVTLAIIFDAISLYLHEKESIKVYINFILPFYALNNVIFKGLFLAYFAEAKLRSYLHISIVVISILILLVYHSNGYFSWSTWGSLIQSITLLIYLLIAIRNVFLSSKKLVNSKSITIIILSLIMVYSIALLINIFYKSMIDESIVLSHLLYGIKNVFWIISHLLTAYAIYKLVVFKPTAIPKP